MGASRPLPPVRDREEAIKLVEGFLPSGMHPLFPNHSQPQLAERIVDALLGQPQGQKITHGRHCTCRACAAEDWTNPKLAGCGMHGDDCPARYQPWGSAGTYFDPVLGQPDPEGERLRENAWKVIRDVDSAVATADLPPTHTLKINVEELRAALSEQEAIK